MERKGNTGVGYWDMIVGRRGGEGGWTDGWMGGTGTDGWRVVERAGDTGVYNREIERLVTGT